MVYGCDLSAFTAVEGLMQCQVKGEQIVLVHPSPPRCFNNPAVLNRVIHELKEAGMYGDLISIFPLQMSYIYTEDKSSTYN